MDAQALHREAPVAGWRLHAMLPALWLGTFWLAGALEHAPHASLWFPPSAVTFAGLLVAGWRAVPALVVACTAATFVTELDYNQSVRPAVVLASSAAFTLLHVAAYALPASLLRMLARADAPVLSLRSVTEFLLLGALGATLAAGGGVLGLQATGLIETDAAPALAAAWWLGDYVALVTLAPLFIAWLSMAAGPGGAHRAADFALFWFGPWRPTVRTLGKLALLLGLTGGILGAHLAGWGEGGVLLALLVLPVVLQLWIVHTEDHATALGAMVAFALLTVGVAAAFPLGDDALVLQFAAVSLAANTHLNLAVPSLYADNARLLRQVSRDSLTGAYSREWFEERATRVLQRARIDGRPVSLAMFDLDSLKAINDTRGHAVGDAVLREVVERCGGVLRPDDMLGRMSGDEFVVLLPDADRERAARAVDRMRRALSNAPLDALGHVVSASFGVAEAGPETSWASLLREADSAMYVAKRAAQRRMRLD
jgi:diguanylate cyclase (GGDEF)-like protein